MNYVKTVWKNKEVERPRTFQLQDNGDGTTTLIPAEGAVVEVGTPVTAVTMNNIEQGIEAAAGELATKADKAPDTVLVTASKTLALSDAGTVQLCNSAGAINITIPPEATVNFPDGTEIALFRAGAGAVSVVAGVGVTIVSYGSRKSIKNQNESACLKKTSDLGVNYWTLIGSLSV